MLNGFVRFHSTISSLGNGRDPTPPYLILVPLKTSQPLQTLKQDPSPNFHIYVHVKAV